MKKILENVTRITTQTEYDLLSEYVEKLLQEATVGGYLSDINADNEYTREIGRLARLGGIYESEFMAFPFGTQSHLVQSVKTEMNKRGLRQRDAAKLLGVPEPSFSRFLRGQKKLTLDFARKLYNKFDIDPKLILG
ncbi:MAG: helix-turn-helix domain-containing protein [Bacteroidales bacterium]|jgi:HTH-type transcriptional regulator/antitoxin HigA|nr:helix-turn-helix domain-containing protein [Bacteroidales bacterium]